MITRVDQHTLTTLQTASGISFVVATAVALPIILAIGSPPLAAAFATVGMGSLATFVIATYLKPKHKRLPPLPTLPQWRRSTVSEAGLTKAVVIDLATKAPRWQEAKNHVNTLLSEIDKKKLRSLLKMIADYLPLIPGLWLPPFGKEVTVSTYLNWGLRSLEIEDKSVCAPLASVLMPVLKRRHEHETELKTLCDSTAGAILNLLEGKKSKKHLIQGINIICKVA